MSGVVFRHWMANSVHAFRHVSRATPSVVVGAGSQTYDDKHLSAEGSCDPHQEPGHVLPLTAVPALPVRVLLLQMPRRADSVG